MYPANLAPIARKLFSARIYVYICLIILPKLQL